MERFSAYPLPHRVSYRFSDPVEFSASLPGGQFECLSWPRGACETIFEILHLPSLSIRVIESAPQTSRVLLEAGTTTLFMQTQSDDAGLRVNGMKMPHGSVGFAAGGMDLTVLAERRVGGIILQLRPISPDSAVDGQPLQVAEDGGVQFLDTRDGACRRLAGELRAAAGMLNDAANSVLVCEHADSLAFALREQVAAALAAAAKPRSPRRALREAVRILRQVDELLVSHLSGPIYTAQICSALQVSPRKLHDAMIATCGMSPHAYLKARRLTLARRSLLSATPEAKLVKRVALAHGFWHFGNFARDYRAMFGESPSETVARAVCTQSLRYLDKV